MELKEAFRIVVETCPDELVDISIRLQKSKFKKEVEIHYSIYDGSNHHTGRSLDGAMKKFIVAHSRTPAELTFTPGALESLVKFEAEAKQIVEE